MMGFEISVAEGGKAQSHCPMTALHASKNSHETVKNPLLKFWISIEFRYALRRYAHHHPDKTVF